MASRRLILTAAVAGVLAVLVGTALAHKTHYQSSITLRIKDIGGSANQYSGKVSSVALRCAKFRDVKIASSGGFIAETTANVNGDYYVLASKAARGIAVTATATRKVVRKKRGHRHICSPAAATKSAPRTGASDG